jgi:hypothetical protein
MSRVLYRVFPPLISLRIVGPPIANHVSSCRGVDLCFSAMGVTGIFSACLCLAVRGSSRVRRHFGVSIWLERISRLFG